MSFSHPRHCPFHFLCGGDGVDSFFVLGFPAHFRLSFCGLSHLRSGCGIRNRCCVNWTSSCGGGTQFEVFCCSFAVEVKDCDFRVPDGGEGGLIVN